MKRATAIITIGSILFMSCFGLLKTEIYGVENNKLCDLVELYENDIKFMRLLLENLDENDDVQNVYHNWDQPDEE